MVTAPSLLMESLCLAPYYDRETHSPWLPDQHHPEHMRLACLFLAHKKRFEIICRFSM